MDLSKTRSSRKLSSAFTLIEVVMSLVIVVTVFGGVLVAYIQAANRAEWSGRALAAQSLAIQQIEQARSAIWDQTVASGNIRNDVTNLTLLNRNYANNVLTGHSWTNLDLPSYGTNFVNATNYVTVTLVSNFWPSCPQIVLRMIRVDAVWPYTWGGTTMQYTNTVCTYSSPDD